MESLSLNMIRCTKQVPEIIPAPANPEVLAFL